MKNVLKIFGNITFSFSRKISLLYSLKLNKFDSRRYNITFGIYGWVFEFLKLNLIILIFIDVRFLY